MSEKKKSLFVYRKKLIFFLKAIIIVALIFIVHQFIIYVKLSKDTIKDDLQHNLILGTHIQQEKFYKRRDDDKFTCIASREIIDYKLINDDYCDCEDGSDEPGTDACPNGQFFCSLQVNYKHYPKSISSNKVNDGICDCCDGSDEWLHKKVSLRLSDEVQKQIHRFQSPCFNMCG